MAGCVGARAASAPHTLRVASSAPETIVLPSGEKATELMQLLCALFFSAIKASEEAPVRGAGGCMVGVMCWGKKMQSAPQAS